MSASAKPTEKVFKSFLAAVLAISLCPLMPAEKAQAEEAGDSGEPADAAQVSDEGKGGGADPTDGALAADGSDADSELAGENYGAEDEGAPDDSNVAMQAASDSGAPIVDWTECGTCQWMIDSSGCLTIKPKSGSTSGELARWYSSEGGPWRSSSFTTVRILHGVKAKTTARMFAACRNLTSADLSGLDTSSVTDMGEMFCNCSSLKSVDLSALDTSSVTNMSEMFSGCSKLAKLDLSSFDTSNVKEGSFSAGGMRGMFSGCSSLASLDLSSFDTSNVTGMGNMFSDCSSLTSLDLSSFDTSNVQGMYDMFSGCSSLASLDLSGFATSSPANMSYMFYNCSALETIRFADPKRLQISNAGSMFRGCSSLASLDLSSLDASSVTSMSSMFSGCSSLSSLDLSSLDTSSVTSMSWMFEGCSSLVSLDLSSFDTSSVTSMTYMFRGCSSLKSLDLSSFDTSQATDMSSMFYYCPKLSSLDLSSFDTSQVTGMSGMFGCCSSLSSLDLSSFGTSSVTSMTSMFYDCQSLASLDLSSFDTSNVTDMTYMFCNCSSLASLDVSGLDTSSVTGMGGMFSGCSSLASLDLSSFDTSQVTEMSCMFYGCSSLASLDLSSFDTSQVTDMSGMFGNCPIQTLELSSFETSQVTNASSMFSGCSSLKSLDLSGFATPKVADMSSMFEGCTSLASLDISHFDTSSASNMANMFWNCSSLRSVALGEKFSFRGAKNARQCSLPKLKGDGLTGFWKNVETHELYAEDEIPNNVAATYIAQVKSEIPKTSISESMFVVDTRAKTYTGLSIKPSVSSDTLNKGTDYDVSYGENMNAGEGTVVITGVGNYVGQVTYSFRIDPRQVGAPEAATGLVYSGVGQVGVAPSDEYEVSNGSATDAGSYTAIVSLVDKQNYEWSGSGNSDDIEVSWSIAKALLTSSMVSDVPSSMEATGSQLTPKPIVTFNGKTLVQGADYSLSYGENVSPGKGSVTVTAVEDGNFTGSVTVEFDIEKKAEPAPEPQQFAVIYHLDGGANATDNPATYMAGTAVPLADPTKEGFEFQGWYADAGFTVRVTEIPSDASGDVELWAKWKEQKPAPVFTDVDYSSWYGDAVSYVASKGLITGYSGTTLFGVGDVLTRAQLATILWRNACPDEYASYDPEAAVDTTGIDGSADGMYYTAAANWAVRNGVITGFDREDGSKDFAADDDVSFEQLVTILSRLCATPDELAAAGSDLSAFADGDLASDWSRGAFAWAAAKGLVQGYDEPAGRYLRPGDPVARERVAVVLMRAFEMGVMK